MMKKDVLEKSQKIRSRAANVAVLAASVLTFFKVSVGLLTGSVGVLSDGIHSFLDLISAGIAFFTVREAGKPADPEHPFGHGKFETLSSLFEAILLVAAACWMIYEGFQQLIDPHPIRYGWVAIVTISISMIVSFLVFRHNHRAAKITESAALRVNALHFYSDVMTSAGILIGLLLIQFTGWTFVDSALAFGVAIYVVIIAWRQIREAVSELVDSQLPRSEILQIEEVLKQFGHQIITAHDLKTRKSGAHRQIDFHLIVCKTMTVDESHRICDDMEARIKEIFPLAQVHIHVEPCSHEKIDCSQFCFFEEMKKRGESADFSKLETLE